VLTPETQAIFSDHLSTWLNAMWASSPEADQADRDQSIRNWLKLAAFVLRKRHIALGGAT
jgi:CRISPR-associated protein Cmr2